MAANTNLFTDKETNNWFKASIALNVTKQGLTYFLETELKNVHAVVGRSCGNCPIEKLIPCPTNPYCNKKKRNYCHFHKSQKPQPCPTCDNVKQNIILQHRYGGPSWRNTRAENWALDYWEIGKCFLPPDGYISVSSVQESDFNGMINIMLNCLHFQTCLSPSCLSPPPPDKQCPLETVRQMGRDVRHTSDCKVTDADLRDYFQTLSALLADPQYLQHDPASMIACQKLSDLQNDRMSIEELGELLKEANQTLKNAKETGERFSEQAERTMSKSLEATILFGEQRLKKKTQVGEQRLKSQTDYGQQRLKSKTKVGEQRLKRKTNIGEQCLASKTRFGDKYIESKTQHGEDRIESKTQYGEQRIKKKTNDAEEYIDSKVQDVKQRIGISVHDGILRMQEAANKTSQVDYKRDVADLRRRLVEHYSDKSSNVPLSVLDQSLDKRITDIYATPKIHRIEIENDGKRVKKEQVLTYTELFYTDNTKSNRRIYVQGEPGSGKSTFAAKLVHDWCDGNRPSTAAPTKTASFDDVLIMQNFQFIFFISLRESRGQTDVMHMIKKQLIDTMFSEEKRDVIYKLLLQIIETELCLVVRDGLDEWMAPDGCNLAEPSMAGFLKDKCTVLTTSRPWKLADERIKNSQIDILVDIEGINDPDTFSERVLRCILDKSKDVKTTAWDIWRFILNRGLTSLTHSPMLYTLVICTWVETMEEEQHLKGSSLCALYTTLLESLCKKANDTIGFFNDLNPPQVRCFSRTSYLQPNMQHVNVISKAAFHLLFSPEKETSIVFSDRKLSNYLSESEKAFALKAGLVSKRKSGKALNASISFIHKSMQEFLAAYHIAYNDHLFDGIISGYLTRHKDAYLDISQVFLFLCGLNILAANKLSGMMDEQNAKMMEESEFRGKLFRSFLIRKFQEIIEVGYREAVSNEQTGIVLRLSHFYVDRDNFRNINKIWTDNTTLVLELIIEIDWYKPSPHGAHSESSSFRMFDLSSCLKLKSLTLYGSGICLQESGSSMSSAFPIWIVLNSADQAQCEDPPPVLPCIKNITLNNVTCSSTCLRSLFSILLTLDHKIDCELRNCTKSPCIEDAVRGSDTKTDAKLTCFKNTSNMLDIENESPGLWEAPHGLNIKSLSLGDRFYGGFKMNHAASMSQSLQSLAHLETLRIKVNYYDPGIEVIDDLPGLWEALHGLNIKSLILSGGLDGLHVNDAESLSRSLLSLTQLETLSIYIEKYIELQLPQLLKCLHIYCRTLLPSELRKLVNTLSACTRTVETKLEFGCASFRLTRIPPEEYMPIKLELETLKNVAVKRFRIFETKTYIDDDAASAWSVRDVGVVDDDNQDDVNVKYDAYERLVIGMSNKIINHISIRLLITPASNS